MNNQLTDTLNPNGDNIGTQPGKKIPPNVVVEGLSKTYPGAETPTFTNLSVVCPAGQITIIVGPSGCGKTTLLRCICGLEASYGGKISFGDRDVTHVDAEKRGVAMVFQNYALYPNKTVAENIAFPLRMAKVDNTTCEQRVLAAARMVRIEDYMDRRPAELSGGQSQRVGIARAIVRGPDVLLMDEPLSNLDTKLRTEMRAELSTLQRKIGATTIYVTHDQTEALTLADHLVVMRDGVVVQQGPPGDIFMYPNSTFVADFMGRMNLFEGEKQGSKFMMKDGTEFLLNSSVKDGQYIVGFRPEEISEQKMSNTGLSCSADIVRRELLGTEVLVHAVLGDQSFRARLPVASEATDRVSIFVAAGHLHFFTLGGKRIDPQQ